MAVQQFSVNMPPLPPHFAGQGPISPYMQATMAAAAAQTQQVRIPVPTFAKQEEKEKEETWLLSVSIRGTSEQLKMLNKFLLDNNIEYRRINCVKE